MKDKQLAKLITAETKRQNETLDLIPSENFVSQDVLDAVGSTLTNKYAEGYPGARYYGGNEIIDKVETLARERALKAFGLSPSAWHVNVQPYSGSPANLAVILALAAPGETIMGLQLAMGGHLTHGHKVSATGKIWRAVQYEVDKNTERLDYDAILELAKRERPRLIIAGYTAYPRVIDWKRFREIADAVEAYLVVDMSHLAGLIAGKAYPSPFPHAHVVTTTTHKTLRGPRSAIIFARLELAKQIDRAIFPGLQGGPHENQIAGIAVAMREAVAPAFKTYAKQIVKNARALADDLKKHGFRLVSGGTDSHLMLVDVAALNTGNPSTLRPGSGQASSGRPQGGREASVRLERNGIVCNMNTIPFDPRPPMDPSGIRLGTPALTTRGMKEKEMKIVAGLIAAVLLDGKNVSAEVKKLCKKFPLDY